VKAAAQQPFCYLCPLLHLLTGMHMTYILPSFSCQHI
jgi:hypothetical protein